MPAIGAWATDITARKGTAIRLDAAPQIPGTPITATVKLVTAACTSHNPAQGGYVVVVVFSRGQTTIGYAAYAHLNPSVRTDQVINRWGTVLGTVGDYTSFGKPNPCWFGVQTHVELDNAHNCACFNKGWELGAAHEFLELHRFHRRRPHRRAATAVPMTTPPGRVSA